jgi:DNA mismatch repair ATPase MutL
MPVRQLDAAVINRIAAGRSTTSPARAASTSSPTAAAGG